MRARNLRDLTADELTTRLADTRKELFNIRFQSATGALENTTRLKLARREIARILTVQKEQERSANTKLATKGLPNTELANTELANAKVQG